MTNAPDPRDAAAAPPREERVARLEVTITRRCGLSCGGCDRTSPDAPDLDRLDVVSRVKDAATRARTVVLTGGDPLVRDELVGLVQLARASGAEVVLALPAGLPPKERLLALATAGVSALRVSLRTLHDEAHRRDARTHALDAAWSHVQPGLDAARDAGLAIEASFPVARGLPAVSERLAAFHARIPDARRHELAVVPHGARTLVADSALPVTEACAELSDAADTAASLGLTLDADATRPLPPCVFPLHGRAARLTASRLRSSPRTPENASDPACATCVLAPRCTLSRADLAPHGVTPVPVDAARADDFLPPGARRTEPARPRKPGGRLRVLGAEDVQRFFHVDYDFEGSDAPGVPTSRVGILYRCNQVCTFCQLAEMDTEIAPETVRAAIEQSFARGSQRLILTGGEPTLSPHLEDHVRHAYATGFRKIEVQTNAVLMDRPGFVDRLVRAGLTSAQVSLHGPDGAISDRLTAAPGTHARTLRGVDALLSAGLTVTLNHLIFRDNAHLLEAFVDLATERWGAHRERVWIQFHTPLNEFERREDALAHIARYSDYAPSLLRAIDTMRARGFPFRDLQDPTGIPALCVLGADPAYVGPILRQQDRRRYHAWESEWLGRATACRQCDLADRCMGIPRAYLDLHGGDEFHALDAEGRRKEPARRAVLVDVRSTETSFVGREDLLRAERILHEHGVETVRIPVRVDVDGNTADLPALLEAVAKWPEARVFVARAWRRTALAEVRQRLAPGGRMVRITPGSASETDDLFDTVLRVEDLAPWLTDGTAPADAMVSRTRDELRRLPLVTDAHAGADHAPSEEHGLPTIAGPAKGCPYLADVRRMDAFRDVGLDPSRDQVHGCSFCVDNAGAYAAFPESETVSAWRSALRALRAVQPGAHEVLLADERPHPYLPAFFTALRDTDRDLAPLSLRIKSRVDWLLEFADTALTEACERARESGSRLVLHLIGFESFDQGHLDLFNKGVTVAQNLAAIDVVRALAARFPDAFSYTADRAHGFVLFTPWTTPESLLENARVIRATRFHEFRSQLLRTRLRLQSPMPLLAKARADGLLAESFDAGRPDRAQEQGYDASVPWRFADPRVEAIYQTAGALAERAHEVPEADVLEFATRWVMRWPGLADTPAEAVLPALEAMASWDLQPPTFFARMGSAAMVEDRELGALLSGERAVCMKENVASPAALVRAYAAMGLHAAEVSRHRSDAASQRHTEDRDGDRGRVAVARDPAALTAFLDAQHAVERARSPEAIAQAGALLGYPACCITAFAQETDHGDNGALEVRAYVRHPDRPVDARAVRMGWVRTLSHFPCTPDCAASVALAESACARVSEVDPVAGARLRDAHGDALLFLDTDRRARIAGRWRDGRFALTRFEPLGPRTWIGAELGSPAFVSFAPGAVIIGDAEGRTRAHACTTPLLLEPGRPLHGNVTQHWASRETGARETASRTPVRVGQEIGPFVVDALTQHAAWLRVRMRVARTGATVDVDLCAWRPGLPCTTRRGTWALTAEGAVSLDQLSHVASDAVALLARALPEGVEHPSIESR